MRLYCTRLAALSFTFSSLNGSGSPVYCPAGLTLRTTRPHPSHPLAHDDEHTDQQRRVNPHMNVRDGRGREKKPRQVLSSLHSTLSVFEAPGWIGTRSHRRPPQTTFTKVQSVCVYTQSDLRSGGGPLCCCTTLQWAGGGFRQSNCPRPPLFIHWSVVHPS